MKTPPSILSKPATVVQPQLKVNFNDNPFNDSILNKGYNVLHAKALNCPCGIPGGEPSPSCTNCGGTGWFYIELNKTKALVQGISSANKQEPWTESNSTTARITMRGEDAPTYEDRITVLDLYTNYTQLLHPKLRSNSGRIYAFTIYDILKVHSAYIYLSDTQPLKLLLPYVSDDLVWDYKIKDNVFDLNPATAPSNVNFSVSIRYQHHPVYYIKTLDREVFHTEVDAKCEPSDSNFRPMPVKCTGIRAHYVPQNNNLTGPRLWDNTDYTKFKPSEILTP